jgi:hypothetical protein
MGPALVGVVLSAQWMFLPTRSMFIEHFGKDRPRMKLPVATHAGRAAGCHVGAELSWTGSGGWVGEGRAIRRTEIEAFLGEAIERTEQRGLSFSLRLRIPAEAKAGIFMEAAMAAQKAAVSHLHMAAVKGG